MYDAFLQANVFAWSQPSFSWLCISAEADTMCNQYFRILGIFRERIKRRKRDGVSNHQPYNYLLNLSFRRRSKKTSKLSVNGLCIGKSQVIGEFPARRASNAENVSIWWRHHVQGNVFHSDSHKGHNEDQWCRAIKTHSHKNSKMLDFHKYPIAHISTNKSFLYHLNIIQRHVLKIALNSCLSDLSNYSRMFINQDLYLWPAFINTLAATV